MSSETEDKTKIVEDVDEEEEEEDNNGIVEHPNGASPGERS
jgi:hypothetical protein